MRHKFILDTEDEEENAKFHAIFSFLNGIPKPANISDEEWYINCKSNSGYSGRMCVSFEINNYVHCCGVKLLEDPCFQWEFYKNREFSNIAPKLNWTVQRFKGTLKDSTGKDLGYPPEQWYVEEYKYTSTKNIITYIKHVLNTGAGRGGYIIFDWANGNNKLFKFVDAFLSRDCFKLESMTSFINGNTGVPLAGWFAKNIRYNRDKICVVKEFNENEAY